MMTPVGNACVIFVSLHRDLYPISTIRQSSLPLIIIFTVYLYNARLCSYSFVHKQLKVTITRILSLNQVFVTKRRLVPYGKEIFKYES